jgi:uncharacterized protein (TIGR03067 family)
VEEEHFMLRRVLYLLACLFTSFIAAADSSNSTDASDLQGRWQAVDAEVSGQKTATDQVEELQIVVQADRLDIKPNSEGRKTTFRLDPGKSPKAIDLIPLDGDRKGTIVPAIYSLQDGQLKLCINIWGKDPTLRPTEFRTQSGDGFALVILRRAQHK